MPSSGGFTLRRRFTPGETGEAWLRRREAELQALKDNNDPLVYAQEYLAEFVDWSG